jgi:soluble lytic murein transglycosylase-like protein
MSSLIRTHKALWVAVVTGALAAGAFHTGTEVGSLINEVRQEMRDYRAMSAARLDSETLAATSKLRMYLMSRDRRIWSALAEYQAAATVAAAKKHNVDLSLLVGVIVCESNGDPFAKSGYGAKGMGQVFFPAHADRFTDIKSERDKYDPEKNIDCAAELLSEYTTRHGIENGLQIYNVGITAFRGGKRSPQYVTKVLHYAQQFRHF